MSADGLLLINLGSPDAPERGAVARYLREFLTDPYVIDIPAPLRFALVYGLIAPTRAGRTARAYQKIWRREGSPLIDISRRFAERVGAKSGTRWDVRWAMRYGRPALTEAVKNWNVNKIFVVPLYPQFAESSTRSAITACLEAVRRERGGLTGLHVLEDFYGEDEFVAAQVRQIGMAMQRFAPDHLLLSFHGLPEHHMTKLHPKHCFERPDCCDSVGERNRSCYRAQAFATANQLRARLPMAAAQVSVSFQSRLGRRPWIQPYTDVVVPELAARGVRRLLVSCPSFVADCLETLEEVQIRLREQFRAAGGEELQLAPALNFEEHWVEAFCKMVARPNLNWQPISDERHANPNP